MFNLNNLLEQFKDDWEFMGRFNYSYDRYDSIESFLDNLFLKKFDYTEDELTWLCRFEQDIKELEPYEEEEWWKHYRQFFEYKNRYFCIEWLLGIPRFSHYDNQPYEVYLEVKKIKTKIETIQEKTIFEFKDIEGKDIDMETTNKVIKYKCDIL